MIDTHCHLLPALDDGPPKPAASIALARRLEEDGVTHVLCTPHYSRMFPTEHDDAVERLRALRDDLGRHSIALETSLAAEVGPGYAVSAPVEELARRSVAERFVLVEVLPDSPATMFETVAARLAEANLIPIFAHPERSRAVQRDPRPLADARRDGALVQIVAPSVLGRWGPRAAAVAWFLLERGLVDLLGSDAHGAARRTVHLREVAAALADRLGAHVPARLTRENPARVLAGSAPG